MTEPHRPRVDPVEQRAGRARVDVSLGPIARMFAAEQWQDPANTGGGAVFAGRADEVIENIPTEPQAGQAPAGLFNLDSHVHDVDSGHPIPYLDVRVEVRRENGTAVFADLPLVPVARVRKGAAGLHYGNNVALAATGRYRVTVHIAAHPLISDTATRNEFTITFAT
jgi:hypothetical protein